MKKISLIITFILIVLSTDAQLVVNQLTATQAVSTLLGPGVTASGITFNGNALQLGEFNGAASNIGLNAGVIISCGGIISSVGPNNKDNATFPGPGFNGPGDAELTALIGGTFVTGDAGVLEFDFVPMGDTIQFNYAFGSEEYNEYVCGDVNDVFGFFLTGKNPLGGNYNAKNLAIVPGTVGTPVSINTVNNGNVGSNGLVSNCSNIDPNWASYNIFFTDNAGGGTVQYDGFTKILAAKAYVVCGETYHIKLAIADGGDSEPDYTYDSGVFIQAGSFSTNTVTLRPSIEGVGTDSILYEGCGAAILNFERSTTVGTEVYNYSIIGGTAIASDYVISSNSVIFLPGEDKFTLSFTAIQDGITEPLETVTIILTQTICSVIDTQKVTFYISDYPVPVVIPHDTLKACENSVPVPIWVDVMDLSHIVSWNTIPVQNTDTIWVDPTVTTSYVVTVSDTCGVYTVVDSAEVVVLPTSPITLLMSSGKTKYCIQDSAQIYVVPSGGGGSYTYSWSPSGSVESSLYVNPILTTNYVVEVTDACGAIKKDSVTITVPNFVPLTANVINTDDTVCIGGLVVLNGNVTGGVGAYLSWNYGLGDASPVNVNPLITTTYVLTGQDSCGATVKDSVTISTNLVHLNLPDSIALTCLEEAVVLDPAITGSNGNETYFWSSGETSSTLAVTPTETTVYQVTVFTDDGCPNLEDSVKVIVPTFIPLEISGNTNLTITCTADSVTLVANIIGGSGQTLIYNWSDGVNTFVGNNIIVNPLVTTTYSVVVIDTCAKDSASSNFTVTLPTYAPLVFDIFSDDTLICIGSKANLEVSAIGGNGNYSYSWSNGSTTPSIQVSPKISSNYQLVVTDGCGTKVDTSVQVAVSAPVADFSFEYQNATAVQFYDSSASNIVAYTWTFDNGTSIEKDPLHTFRFEKVHEVWLWVKNKYGCVDSVMKTVSPTMLVYAPNSFTPNGDELNGTYKVKGVGIASFNLLIYNRWGELLFETNNINNGWDGIFKGKEVPTGTYVYKVRAISYQDVVYEKVGDLNLIK
jgi:gliding motility-associated-like protein